MAKTKRLFSYFVFRSGHTYTYTIECFVRIVFLFRRHSNSGKRTAGPAYVKYTCIYAVRETNEYELCGVPEVKESSVDLSPDGRLKIEITTLELAEFPSKAFKNERPSLSQKSVDNFDTIDNYLSP